MENYIREIIDVCKLPFNEINKDIKVVQIGTGTIYICNFKKIIDYSVEKIVLKCHRGVLEILGNGLSIAMINKREIVINGYIKSFGSEVDSEKNKK